MEKENSVYMGKYMESDEFVYILSGEKEETMKAYKRLIAGTAAAVMLALTCGGCGAEKEPVTITIWNYYNGEQLEAFNRMVQNFNDTVGKEQGITVESASQGSVNDLETNVLNAAAGKVGAEELPNIFSGYAAEPNYDNMFAGSNFDAEDFDDYNVLQRDMQVDGGLRYDLTVPLARYYANHANELPSPFKALQIGNVWRADRPQRGRFRQFMQCDIDILGEPGNLAEIELILATTTMLGKMDFHNFTVCINDRNILKAMAAFSGFKEEDFDEVFIILDKMDKIGKEGVGEELVEMGYTKENVDTYLGLFDEINPDVDGIRFCKEKLAGFLDEKTADSMEMIISSVESAKEADFKVKFDPTLVRGQSYYTGTIFEVTMDEFGGSVAGGGRYDKMIGKFTGQDTPACGFSIGFERIVMLLLENGYEIPSKRQKKAYLLEKNMHKEGILKVLEMAKADRAAGKQVLVVNMKKNKKFQKDQLIAEGYEDITDCYKDSVMDL